MPTGIRGTVDLGVTRKYDIADVISLLDVAEYPMLSILTNAGKDPVTKQGKAMKKKETTDPEYKWFEDKFQERMDLVVGNHAAFNPAVGGAIAMANEAYFSVGDVIYIPANSWNYEVTAVGGADITVGAELGGDAAPAQIDDSAEVYIIGNANEEGGTPRAIKASLVASVYNYCQIFKTSIGITETARNTKGWTKENDFDYQARKKAIEHAVDIERAFFFGKRAELTSGTHPKRFTGGIAEKITQSVSAIATRADFEGYLEVLFAHGGNEKYLFASPYVVAAINEFAVSKLQVLMGEKTFGLQIIKYISPHGTLNIIKHKLLTGDAYGKSGIGIDMEQLTYRYLTSRDTKLLTNRQAPGEDSRVDEYLTECGLQFELPDRHAVATFA